jgi:hypothetical protein
MGPDRFRSTATFRAASPTRKIRGRLEILRACLIDWRSCVESLLQRPGGSSEGSVLDGCSAHPTGGPFKTPCRAESLIADDLDIPIARARAVLSLVPGRDTGAQAHDVGFEVGRAWGPRGTRPWWSDVAGTFRGQTLVNPPDSHYGLPSAVWRFTRYPDWLSAGTRMAGFQLPLTPKTAAMNSKAATSAVRCARAEQIGACDARLGRARRLCASASWRLSPRLEPLARADWLTTDIHMPHATPRSPIWPGLNFLSRTHLPIGSSALPDCRGEANMIGANNPTALLRPRCVSVTRPQPPSIAPTDSAFPDRLFGFTRCSDGVARVAPSRP